MLIQRFSEDMPAGFLGDNVKALAARRFATASSATLPGLRWVIS